VGLGFDVHPFSDDPTRRLVLGGVVLDGRGLAGHSDADVIAHAVADALLGAAGLDDIGTLFPASDPSLAGIDSMELLTRVVLMVGAHATVGNVDVKVVLEAPRLAPHRQVMAERLGKVVGAPVSVTAKRAEGLGALGRQEGVACWAVALVSPHDPPASRQTVVATP
jgi:2-C-methyl-D-erythritol 2,4-cyclodiphosphate synthase